MFLLLLQHWPSTALLYLMVCAQGVLGYSAVSVLGAITTEIFEGPHHGAILGTILVAAIVGGALGPWLAGELHDAFGNYVVVFWLTVGVSLFAALAIWIAAPRKVRVVAGQMHRLG